MEYITPKVLRTRKVGSRDADASKNTKPKVMNRAVTLAYFHN